MAELSARAAHRTAAAPSPARRRSEQLAAGARRAEAELLTPVAHVEVGLPSPGCPGRCARRSAGQGDLGAHLVGYQAELVVVDILACPVYGADLLGGAGRRAACRAPRSARADGTFHLRGIRSSRAAALSMQGTGAAERDQRTDPAGPRPARSRRCVLPGPSCSRQCSPPRARPAPRCFYEALTAAELVLGEGPPGAGHAKRHLPAEETARVEPSEHRVRVSDGRARAAPAVADAASLPPALSGADLKRGPHSRRCAMPSAAWAPISTTSTTGNTHGDGRWRSRRHSSQWRYPRDSAAQQGGLGGCPAHVEGFHGRFPGRGPQRSTLARDHAADRTRLHGHDWLLVPGSAEGHNAPVGLHDLALWPANRVLAKDRALKGHR